MAFTKAPISAVITDAKGNEVNLGQGSGPFTAGPTSIVITDKDGNAVTVGAGGGTTGTVTSVIGTANQITSDGSTTTPTLSLPATVIAPGSVTATTTLGMKGATSGTATITAPAVAGTSTNAISFSNILSAPGGAAATPSYSLSTASGMWKRAGSTLDFSIGSTILELLDTPGMRVGSGAIFCWASGAPDATAGDTGLSRDAAAVIDVGNGTVGDKSGRLNAATLSTGTAVWKSGTGSPETVVTAPVGSLYTRTDGSTSTTLYVKETGAGNTGWVAK